jgi:PDZ domain
MRVGLRIALACAVGMGAIGGASAEPAATEKPPVALPAFHIVDLGFSIHWEGDASGRIVRVAVTEVRPGSPAWKYGLRRNDALKAIDHRPLLGMKRDDFLSLMEANWEQSRARTYTFVRSRGFIVYVNSSFDLTWSLRAATPVSPDPRPR